MPNFSIYLQGHKGLPFQRFFFSTVSSLEPIEPAKLDKVSIADTRTNT